MTPLLRTCVLSLLAAALALGGCASAPPANPAPPRQPDPLPPPVKLQEASPKERAKLHADLGAGYYERSLTGLATLCVEKGIVGRDELERRAGGLFPLALASAPGRTNAATRDAFKRGDRVRVKDDHVPGHVRMPGYIRGKTGVVVGESPAYPFPDAHAHGIQAEDELTYDVRFRSEDLWPNSSDKTLIHVAVFQSYLARAL